MILIINVICTNLGAPWFLFQLCQQCALGQVHTVLGCRNTMLCCMIDLEKKLMINPRHKCKSHVKKNYTPQRVWRRKLEIIYSGTFPLGYLYSRDKVSDQVPEKCPHNLCIYYLFWRDTSIRGKGHNFGVPKPVFSLHSGDTLAIKKWLITKRIDILSVNF